ncbi:hypothetical protein L596_021626 [Steinernema carpocapsae]|uniref:Uncharacterized protein n=1 Tax=Steinernema carpocapsae TaxID=34508 RepID=A0A4U5MJC6_STECR|nr:hypothetical protein L596_021626 [Steinernema carpocapsae]
MTRSLHHIRLNGVAVSGEIRFRNCSSTFAISSRRSARICRRRYEFDEQQSRVATPRPSRHFVPFRRRHTIARAIL